MTKYYVYCEQHGRLPGSHDTPDAASQQRMTHLLKVKGPHGRVNVIEEYEVKKYGQTVTSLRKFRRNR